ncbi:MAG: hypothetical protein M0P91_03925 [Sulfuricurvum sp.]|jgi:hypothetical protein|uniref:hypothetical protein n=1 Tax=Sulfuricurvum sp. TaxID=2025608 RepID=UPI0025EA4C8D|nr:hypothetical protein [Sulfuricurvum sp.]MCK9372320.1 hypothetical protein [Sulfuricurvum sp.]
MFLYQIFQLSITAPFECPELLEGDAQSAFFPKITVRYGKVPDHLEAPLNAGPIFEATNDMFLLKIQEVGNYLIRNGNEIIIDPLPDVPEQELRLFLLGSAIGALMNQRGYLLIHASAIATPKGAILFTGPSGVGKSTTIQGFIERGYQKMSDDAIALYYDESSKKVMILPSYPNAKLWQKSADILGKNTDNLPRIRPTFDKFYLSTKEYFCNTPLELAAVYQIVPTRLAVDIELEEVNSMEKLQILFRNVYRKVYAENLHHKQNHFTIGTLAAKQSIIKRIKRSDCKNSLALLLDTLEADFSA